MFEEITSEIRRLQTEVGDLRTFGITMAVVLGLLTGLALWRQSGAFPYLFILAIAFWFAGVIFPKSLKPIYLGWMSLAIVLGFFVTKIILSVLFYVMFTIIGVIARTFHHDMLDEEYDPEATTYWKPYQPPKDAKKHLERQF